VIAVEVGLLTPPFGLSVFTVKATLADPTISVEAVFGGAMPYILIMLGSLILISVFPALSLALL
jgi:TRAP-type C4-dicarboxylate transport system permease large subunit